LDDANVTWPAAGQDSGGVPVSDRDRPLISIRSGTPRARRLADAWPGRGATALDFFGRPGFGGGHALASVDADGVQLDFGRLHVPADRKSATAHSKVSACWSGLLPTAHLLAESRRSARWHIFCAPQGFVCARHRGSDMITFRG